MSTRAGCQDQPIQKDALESTRSAVTPTRPLEPDRFASRNHTPPGAAVCIVPTSQGQKGTRGTVPVARHQLGTPIKGIFLEGGAKRDWAAV